MPEKIGSSKITQAQFYELAEDMILELSAVFNVMKDDAMKLLSKAEDEGWDGDRLIKEVEKLI